MVKIRQLENNKIGVSSPYDTTFVERARQLGGKFQHSTKEWIFDNEDREKVEDICIDIFAECDKPIETVRIEISLYEYIKANSKCVFNHELILGLYAFATSKGRDSYVEIADNVIVSKGRLYTNGSVKNHYVDYTDNTVLTFKKLPKRIYERIKDYDGVTFIKENELETIPDEKSINKYIALVDKDKHSESCYFDIALGIYEAENEKDAICKAAKDNKKYIDLIYVYRILN